MTEIKSQREFLAERYQQMWDDAIDPISQGQVTIDPLLARREADQRRSLTVLIRPSIQVQKAVINFLHLLRAVDPEQHYYASSELHVTLLSLFTGTLDHARLLKRYDKYLEAVTAALSNAASFEIEFTGVTLSREAILIQGFPAGDSLNSLREALRRELRGRGLTEGLDARYTLQTAHMTAVRFRTALQKAKDYAEILADYRSHPFGQTKVEALHLVRNDWYMSAVTVDVLKKYPIGVGTPA